MSTRTRHMLVQPSQLREALTVLYPIVHLTSFPKQALAVTRSLVPAQHHTWLRVDCVRKLVLEEANEGTFISSHDVVRHACSSLCESHPCIQEVLKMSWGHGVFKLSDLVDFETWKKSEYYKLIHKPNGIRDGMVAACKRAQYCFLIGMGSTTIFTDADCAMMLDLLPHVELAWRNSRAFSETTRSHGAAHERFMVRLERDGREEKWPDEVVGALRKHSSSPVLTFRHPLPEDFLEWLTELRKTLEAPGSATQKTQPYIAGNAESRLTARLIPGTGVLGACIAIEVSTLESFSCKLAQRGLSPRECEVAHWMAQGKRNGDIGEIIGCETNTVRKHVQSIFEKLGVESRSAVIAMVSEK